MRRIIIALSSLIVACTPVPAPVAPGPLVPIRQLSAAAGPWRQVTVDGVPVVNGYRLEFMYPNGDTFIASKGCVISQGVLQPLTGGNWQVARYGSGFSSDTCGPFRAGPAVAPFDGERVRLHRSGDRLVVDGGGKRYLFEAISVDRRIATLAQVSGRWSLAGGNGVALAGVHRATLTLGQDLFSLFAQCDGYSSNGLVLLPGLRLSRGGNQDTRQTGDCDERGIGDRLVQDFGETEFFYLPAVDRIEARAPGGRRLLFARQMSR